MRLIDADALIQEVKNSMNANTCGTFTAEFSGGKAGRNTARKETFLKNLRLEI